MKYSSTKNHKTRHKFFILLVFIQFLFLPHALFAATAQDVVINIKKNNSITIDLSGSIQAETNQSLLLVSIASPPLNGTAEVVGSTSILYTPTNDFVGNDQLRYSVLEDDLPAAEANIQITVGNIIDLPDEDQHAETPESGIAIILNDICTLAGDTSSFQERCNELEVASDEEKAKALREIAPEEIATQNQTGDTLALSQLRSIGKRLSALRVGSRGLSLNDFSFQLNQNKVSLTDLFQPFSNQADGSSDLDEFGLLSDKFGLFVSGNLSDGSRKTTEREDGYQYDSNGITLGIDYRLTHQIIIGVASSLSKTTLDIADNGGDLEANGVSIITYGSYYPSDKLFVDLILTSAQNDYDSTRHINYTAAGNTIDETADGSTASQLTALSLGLGYSLIESQGLNISALGNIDYLSSTIEGYTETGADELNLTIDKRSLSTTLASIGVQTTYPISQTWGILVPQLNIAWEYDLNADSDAIKGSFADDTATTTFEFDTDVADENYFRVGAGASFVLPHGISGFLLYETVLEKRYSESSNISFGARFERLF